MGLAARFAGLSTQGRLREPRTVFWASFGILQYRPDSSGAVDVSAGDRHCDAGRKPVRQGGGWLMPSARLMGSSFS